jgi:hypothetical protein
MLRRVRLDGQGETTADESSPAVSRLQVLFWTLTLHGHLSKRSPFVWATGIPRTYKRYQHRGLP